MTLPVVVGCGDDGGADADTARAKSKLAMAEEPPAVFAERMAKLLETTDRRADCLQLQQISDHSMLKLKCPAPKQLRESMADFKVLGARTYGPAAVIDYKSGKVPDGGSMILFVAPDRKWGVGRMGLVAGRTINTEDNRDDFDKAIEGYLAAVRDQDCDAYYDYTFDRDESKKKVCSDDMPLTKPLAKRLKANPDAKPEYRGGSKVFGFYLLETSKPTIEAVAIGVFSAQAGSAQPYAVANVTPTVNSVQQRDLERQFEEQKGKKSGPERSKSKKADQPAEN